MTKHLKKDSVINVNDPAYIKAFETCKNILISHPVLAYPDLDKQFERTTDASNFAIGCVLEQNGHPISYMSRTLNEHEINYSTIEKELLAIIFGCNKFRPYLFGKPLSWLMNINNPNSRLLRWRLE